MLHCTEIVHTEKVFVGQRAFHTMYRMASGVRIGYKVCRGQIVMEIAIFGDEHRNTLREKER